MEILVDLAILAYLGGFMLEALEKRVLQMRKDRFARRTGFNLRDLVYLGGFVAKTMRGGLISPPLS